jgi:hypothetical protein
MVLLFKVDDAKLLKNEILEQIFDKKFKTWSKSEKFEGDYIIHKEQWEEKGAINLFSDSSNKILIATVKNGEKNEINIEDFERHYLGRFCQFMLVNFHSSFTAIEKIKALK